MNVYAVWKKFIYQQENGEKESKLIQNAYVLGIFNNWIRYGILKNSGSVFIIEKKTEKKHIAITFGLETPIDLPISHSLLDSNMEWQKV